MIYLLRAKGDNMFIFLDIDGVLNTSSDWGKLYTVNKACLQAFCEYVSKIKNCKIVFTSSWRRGYGVNDNPHLAEIIKELRKAGVVFFDLTKTSPNDDREKEILHYLKWHEKDEFLVVDDDKSYYSELVGNVYFTNPNTGFAKADAKKIGRRKQV